VKAIAVNLPIAEFRGGAGQVQLDQVSLVHSSEDTHASSLESRCSTASVAAVSSNGLTTSTKFSFFVKTCNICDTFFESEDDYKQVSVVRRQCAFTHIVRPSIVNCILPVSFNFLHYIYPEVPI